jgi:CarD family transcriptional regulator
MMIDEAMEYAENDWIVHQHYGIGQIKSVETREIAGKVNSYYKVVARNSTYYVPVDKSGSERVRPVTSTSNMRRIIRTLQNPSKDFSNDYKERKREIKERLDEGTLVSKARIVRDLSAWRKSHRLNTTEEEIFDQLTERLIMEWAVCMEMEVGEVRSKLHGLLAKMAVQE